MLRHILPIRLPSLRLLAMVTAFGVVSSVTALPAEARRPKRVKLTDEAKTQIRGNLEAGYRSGDFAIRTAAVDGLGKADKKYAITLLKDALKDPQWQVRRAAIKSLLAQKDRTWETAISAAFGNQALSASGEVMPLLEPVGRKKGIKLLMAALENPKFAQPERYVDALVALGGDWMVDGVAAGLRIKKNPDAAKRFAATIGSLPLPDALPLYARIIKKAPLAMQAAILDQVALNDGDTAEDIGFLAPLVKSKDGGVAFKAALALAHRGDAVGRAILEGTITAETPNPEQRLKALQALVFIADKPLLKVINPLVFKDETDGATLRAIYAINAKVTNPKLVKHLVKRLESVNLERRAAAVRYLGQVQGREATGRLHILLRDGAKIIRMEAARAIGDIQFRGSLDALRMALEYEPHADVKVEYIRAMKAIRDPAAVPFLRFQTSDIDRDVRLAVVEALAAIHHADALPDLELVLRDADSEVRRAALLAILSLGLERNRSSLERAFSWLTAEDLMALTKTHGGKMLPSLKKALRSDRPVIRTASLAAIRTLNTRLRTETALELIDQRAMRIELRLAGLATLIEIQGQGAIDRARALTVDATPEMRQAAVVALGDLRATAAMGLLTTLLNDKDERVRVAAAGALLRL